MISGQVRETQAERTSLAYRRTELAFVVTALVVAREAPARLAHLSLVAGCALAAAGALAGAHRRRRRLRTGDLGADRQAVGALVTATICLQLVAVLAVLI